MNILNVYIKKYLKENRHRKTDPSQQSYTGKIGCRDDFFNVGDYDFHLCEYQ